MAYSDDDDDRSSLHEAAFNRDVEALRRLLSQDAVDPNFSPNQREVELGSTPLHRLCSTYSPTHRDKERSAICFELLRAAGADVNARDNIGGRPLHGRGLPPEIVRHVVSFWLHAGYYDEGTEADEAKYDSLVADITRKVAEMASPKGPRASVTATRLSKLLERDSANYEEDSEGFTVGDDYTAGS